MKRIILTIFTVLSLTMLPYTSVQAVDVFPQCNGTNANTVICTATRTDRLFGAGGLWNTILNIFTYIIGAVAVLMIIIGGLRYTTSNGDPTTTTSAKNTILYAVIGLIVAMMANAIVNFVLTNV